MFWQCHHLLILGTREWTQFPVALGVSVGFRGDNDMAERPTSRNSRVADPLALHRFVVLFNIRFFLKSCIRQFDGQSAKELLENEESAHREGNPSQSVCFMSSGNDEIPIPRSVQILVCVSQSIIFEAEG
jgi:hypothetical protein